MKIESLILLGVFALASSTIRAEPQAATTADPQSNVLPPTTSQRRLPAAAPVWETTKDVDVLIAAAQSRLKQEMLMEPPGDSVRDILMVLRHEAPERPEVQELAREVFKRMLQKGRAAMLAKAYERSAQMLQAAREIGAGFNDPALVQAESELSRTREQSPALGVARMLRRTKYVAPMMPQMAIGNGIEGFVEITFTITTDGTVKELAVTYAQPRGIFEEAALTAVSQWEYQAVTRYGKPVEQRSLSRVKFELPQT